VSERYDLEGVSTDSYLLEDGSGVLLIDQRVEVKNDTLQLTELSLSVFNLKFVINDILGLTDVENKVTGFVKNAATDIVGLVGDTVNYISTLINFYRLEDDTGYYRIEDDTGVYLLDQLQDLKYSSDTVGVTEASQKIPGFNKIINEIMGITETINRARTMVRSFIADTVGIIDVDNRLGTIKRNFSDTVGLTESENHAFTLLRNLSDTIGLTEASEKIRGRIKNISDTIGLTETLNDVRGIVKEIADTIGLTEVTQRLRSVFISVNLGNFIATAAINLSNFYALAGYDLESMTATDSYNAGNFTITDDN
jgi:hypothetical protein